MLKKSLSVLIIIAFSLTTITGPVAAQTALNLPAPGTMVSSSTNMLPMVLRGIQINPDNPLQLDFLIDRGDALLEGEAFKTESTKLIKYFLASITIPEDQMWVNLSPYEENRIIPNEFGETEMGRDLLAQDYMLKQLSSSLLYPEHKLGEKFWKRVQTQAKKQFGGGEIPANAMSKIWIIPQEAKIYEHAKGAFIVESRLKVMMENDYLAYSSQLTAHSKNENKVITGNKKLLAVSGNLSANTQNQQTEILREILIPEIEREVNEGEIFANLRQIYNSMLLATWYKHKLKDSLLGQTYTDKAKIEGFDVDPLINQKIYDQYVASFKQGAYEIIKEEYDPETQNIIPRKYFSGGMNITAAHAMTTTPHDSEVYGSARALGERGGATLTQFEMTSSAAMSPALPFWPKGLIVTEFDRRDLRMNLTQYIITKFTERGFPHNMNAFAVTHERDGYVNVRVKVKEQELRANQQEWDLGLSLQFIFGIVADKRLRGGLRFHIGTDKESVEILNVSPKSESFRENVQEVKDALDLKINDAIEVLETYAANRQEQRQENIVALKRELDEETIRIKANGEKFASAAMSRGSEFEKKQASNQLAGLAAQNKQEQDKLDLAMSSIDQRYLEIEKEKSVKGAYTIKSTVGGKRPPGLTVIRREEGGVNIFSKLEDSYVFVAIQGEGSASNYKLYLKKKVYKLDELKRRVDVELKKIDSDVKFPNFGPEIVRAFYVAMYGYHSFLNHAMVASEDRESVKAEKLTHGGVDLNAALGTMDIQKDGGGVVMPTISQEILDKAMNVNGYIPVLINVNMSLGVPQLFMLLGLKEEDQNIKVVNT